MKRVKGATASDQAAHRIFDADLNRMKTGAICSRCAGELKTAYHEERLYSVKCDNCKTITLVKARSLYDAAENVAIVSRNAVEV